MQVIPVIDLKSGQVVHARHGRRESYRPMRSPLCPSADPVAVLRALRSLFPFPTLYVADLDAIAGRGDNAAVLDHLRESVPDLTLWVDSGLAAPAACRAWLSRGLGDLVLGSESQRGPDALRELTAAEPARVLLSLDFQGEHFLGPPAILADPTAWPERVIVMTLARVGSGEGPDFERLAAIRALAPRRRLFAAGGLRDADDLRQLAQHGAAGVLAASALHDGRIGRDALARLAADG